MFRRFVALSVLAVWLGLIGLGYASSDNLDTYIVPSIVALDSQDYGDDVDSHRPIDLAILPGLFFMALPLVPVDQGLANMPESQTLDRKPFQINCSFLL